MKKVTSLLLVVLAVLLVVPAITLSVGASSAYQTYTYSIDGTALYSPYAARINEHETTAQYVHLARNTIARNTRLVEDDGDAFARYAVE